MWTSPPLNYSKKKLKKIKQMSKQPANSNIKQKRGKKNMWIINLILIFNKTSSIPS